MSAVALLARARDAGVEVHVDGGDLRLRGRPDPDLVQAIREAKPVLVAILRGYRCRWCGEPMAWPGPAGVVEAPGTALHHQCYEESEVAQLLAAGERVTQSADALDDEGELMLQPGGLS